MKELNDSKNGVFKLNAEDKDIKEAAVDEVWYNFMRRHQVAEETSDTHLSVLIKQNQDRASRNMLKTQDKLRRKESSAGTGTAMG